MPQTPDWKHVLETGMNFTEVRREKAQKMASDLVSQGQLARDQLGAAVDEIVETSRRASEEFRAAVAAEVRRQLRVLGIAGKEAVNGRAAKPRTATAKQAAAKKAPAKKAGAKKPAAKQRATTTKAAAKKPAAKKAVAKKPAAKKKTAAKKAPAKATKATPAARAR